MDYKYYQEYVEKINGMAGIYSFDIMPDGSFSEIRLIALNKMNGGVLNMNPDAPKFYSGIPWRTYFTDINFESYIYNCASNSEFLYSYTNAHGFWLKGFYLPLKETEEKDGYLYLRKDWQGETEILLTLPSPVRFLRADTRVRENAGKVALMHGPFVYCMEEKDNGGNLHLCSVPRDLSPACIGFDKTEIGGREATILLVPGLRETEVTDRGL